MNAELAEKLDEVLQRLRRLDGRRTEDCSQAAFHKLPHLVQRATFMEWTGLNRDDLASEIVAGRIEVYKPAGREHALYYKREIARLTGLKL